MLDRFDGRVSCPSSRSCLPRRPWAYTRDSASERFAGPHAVLDRGTREIGLTGQESQIAERAGAPDVGLGISYAVADVGVALRSSAGGV